MQTRPSFKLSALFVPKPVKRTELLYFSMETRKSYGGKSCLSQDGTLTAQMVVINAEP